MTNNLISFPKPPKRLDIEDLMAAAEGGKALLLGNEANPHPPENTRHAAWDWGYKYGARGLLALWLGMLQPHAENDYPPGEDDDGRHQWYDRGQRIALALIEHVGFEKYEELVGRRES